MLNFGKACDKCRIKSVMRVHDPLFYWKVATEGNLGLAEAYINGCFSFLDKREGLLNLFLILILNRDVRRSCRSARKGFYTFNCPLNSNELFDKNVVSMNLCVCD